MNRIILILFIGLCLPLSNVLGQSTTPVTLKVIDKTAGEITNDIQKISSWVAMWSPSYVEQSNTGSWYCNFFDGYTGGKLEKSTNEWVWSFTFNAQLGGSFSWNPSIGTPGVEDALAPKYGLREQGKNIDFYVSSSGKISGEVTMILAHDYAALADADGNVTNRQELSFNIPVKIIDKSKGTAFATRFLIELGNLDNLEEQPFGWIVLVESEGVEVVKNEHEWIYSFTFEGVPETNYEWRPATGTEDQPVYLLDKYGITDRGLFTISKDRQITGKNILVIFSDSEAKLIDYKYEIDYLGELPNTGNDFLHAEGRWIVDGNGEKIILRGIGLGNYQLLEPYMWSINSAKDHKSDTQQAILASLAKLTDKATVDAFMKEYRKAYMAEIDVQLLKEAGFNSIRLPMHYNLYLDESLAQIIFRKEGFDMIDELLEWCKKHEIYLILDMHAVPGGQGNDKAISDNYSPGLWDGNENGTAAQYQTQLITLWGELARRYADEKWIGGYDLINEINYYPSRDLAPEIRSLYERITAAIREVDDKHLIFIEGNGYANDFDRLTPPWDSNMAYSFHRYWTTNTQGTIQWMLDIRNTHKIPIWMGESGENSNTWFTDAIELLEKHEIGWAWWAYKKLDNISGFVSIPRPAGWNSVLSYLQSSSDNIPSGLTPAYTKEVLDELVYNTRLENAKINKDVIYALISQPFNNDTSPYNDDNILPKTLFANEYDLGKNGYAYNEDAPLSRESQSAGAYNQGWVGRNDAVDMESCSATGGNGYNIGWSDPGEWQNFTVVNPGEAGIYALFMSYAVSGTGSVTIKVNGSNRLTKSLANTGAWSTYNEVLLGWIALEAGENVIQVYVNQGFNYAFLRTEYLWPVGIENVDKAKAIPMAVYPTVATEEVGFYVSKDEPGRVYVYSTSGRLIDTLEANGQELHYNTSALAPGIYQVVFLSKSGWRATGRFIRK